MIKDIKQTRSEHGNESNEFMEGGATMIYDYEVLTGKGEKLKLADYKVEDCIKSLL